ncbi:hypothetical protein, variant [Aphanomyces astaci]|uniref:Uncharacterized protein n=1 Tax=Aphanomyces astaci TaxID=112090 RepID=W4GYC3_APHAT|nr:hypothetical protein, variant [Aphanomyces astaci]ETV84331.1 hypothetical protein, variant [Aphanomyces astaci]|eukprot:XP_009826023.1 hypothetical protein, variant [Aphanomyces astaci]
MLDMTMSILVKSPMGTQRLPRQMRKVESEGRGSPTSSCYAAKLQQQPWEDAATSWRSVPPEDADLWTKAWQKQAALLWVPSRLGTKNYGPNSRHGGCRRSAKLQRDGLFSQRVFAGHIHKQSPQASFASM